MLGSGQGPSLLSSQTKWSNLKRVFVLTRQTKAKLVGSLDSLRSKADYQSGLPKFLFKIFTKTPISALKTVKTLFGPQKWFEHQNSGSIRGRLTTFKCLFILSLKDWNFSVNRYLYVSFFFFGII